MGILLAGFSAQPGSPLEQSQLEGKSGQGRVGQAGQVAVAWLWHTSPGVALKYSLWSIASSGHLGHLPVYCPQTVWSRGLVPSSSLSLTRV